MGFEEKLIVVDPDDPFDRGPREYFSGTDDNGPDNCFLEGANFHLDERNKTLSSFTHPWLGELKIRHQETCVLTLSDQLNSFHVQVIFSDQGDEQHPQQKTIAEFLPKQPRNPLSYYPLRYGQLVINIDRLGQGRSLSFAFYGLTEGVR